MIIAVTAKGKTLDDQVDPRFGRCPYFLVVDTETSEAEAIENPNLALGGGAGIQSAQLMAERNVKVVLTGNCGPNAYQTLAAAEVEIIVGASGTIREAVEQFKSGALSSTQGPNVASHFGMGTDAGGQATPQSAQAGGQGSQDAGIAAGGGMGMGRGMGRGMGMGGGMGAAPMEVSPTPQAGGTAVPGLPGPRGGNEIEALKAEAQSLEAQLQAINARLAQIQSGSAQARLVAVVNTDECTGCALCTRVCPVGAVTVDTVAAIDTARCTGCGRCVAECPQDALTLKKG